MLFGGYQHNIDKKGRVFIPAKLREELGEEFYICRSIFGKRCLCVYSQAEWDKLVQQISTLPNTKSNDVKRFLYDGTFTVGFDSQGRILIQSALREYSMLQEEAHIIGMASNLEIWNTELWAAENSKYTPEAIASIVEELNF
ncbi:MAG: division/cell wall cluster transcriptional repressor MraZ [Clostridia bacterium]|nr:division/cell wall cluster transcriptional repressor MraZ [Clostridia bacterium]